MQREQREEEERRKQEKRRVHSIAVGEFLFFNIFESLLGFFHGQSVEYMPSKKQSFWCGP